MTRAVAALFLALATGEVAPVGVTGFASAYAPGRMDEVIAYRMANDLWRTPPRFDWYQSHGGIATNDCSQVGQMARVYAPDGKSYEVLIADCGGAEAGGGAARMTEKQDCGRTGLETMDAAHRGPRSAVRGDDTMTLRYLSLFSVSHSS